MLFEVSPLIKDLNSPYWNTRLGAISTLKSIDNAKDCLSFYRSIEKEDDNSLRFTFLQALDDFILSQNEDLGGAALYCLINYSQKENKKVSSRAKKVIDSFIHSAEVIRYQKLSAVRSAWLLLTYEKRKYLTSIILTNKLSELVPLLLLNFKSSDDELISKTIDGLRNFGDARGNQFIKACLEDSSRQVRISAIKAIGELGSILDYKSLRQCLNDNDAEIQIAAVSSYGKLLGRFAHEGLKSLFSTTQKIVVKKEILSYFGKQKSKKALEFLLETYFHDSDPNVVLYSEWGLYESRYSKKVEFLLSRYEELDLTLRYKMLDFLKSLFDEKLVDFYVKILKKKEDPFLVMTVIDSLSHYNSPKAIQSLNEALGDFQGDYSTYAMLSLFKVKDIRVEKIIEDFISCDFEVKHAGHEVVLKAIKSFNKKISDKEKIGNYLSKIVSEGKLSQKVLCLEVSHFFISEELYQQIVGLLTSSESDVVRQAIYKCLAKMISLRPSLLDGSNDFIDHPQFGEVFDSKKADFSLVKSIGRVFNQRPVDWGIAFLYLHGRNLTNVFLENLAFREDDEDVDFFLSHMDKSERKLSRKVIVHLQSNFYDDASRARKLNILSLSCLNPDQENFSFFYDKVRELFDEDFMRHELTGQYMRGLCE